MPTNIIRRVFWFSAFFLLNSGDLGDIFLLCIMMGGQLYIFLPTTSFPCPLMVQGLDGWNDDVLERGFEIPETLLLIFSVKSNQWYLFSSSA